MSTKISTNWFDQTPDSAYLRERQLVGDKRDPASPKLLPVSRATLWRMVSGLGAKVNHGATSSVDQRHSPVLAAIKSETGGLHHA